MKVLIDITEDMFSRINEVNKGFFTFKFYLGCN